MRLIDKYRPTTYQSIVGNKKTVDRIYRAVDDNDGFGGLVIMLLGKTGNGKTLLADIIARDINGDLYRPDCTKDAETAVAISVILANAFRYNPCERHGHTLRTMKSKSKVESTEKSRKLDRNTI